jgi:hypothetical protein
MAGQRITKRVVDSLEIKPNEYALWDGESAADWRQVVHGNLQGRLGPDGTKDAVHDRGRREDHTRAGESAGPKHSSTSSQ